LAAYPHDIIIHPCWLKKTLLLASPSCPAVRFVGKPPLGIFQSMFLLIFYQKEHCWNGLRLGVALS
jgi:hypothetical protein